MNTAVIFVLLALILTGCTTTKNSRQHDFNTAEMIREYREKQQARIEGITDDYQKEFAEQMNRLNTLGSDDFSNRLDLQRSKMADAMTVNWGAATAPTAFQIGFYEGLQEEFMFLAEIDQALADARKAYAATYTEIQLELTKIKAAEQAMRDLSIKPSARKELEQLIRILYDAYKDAEKARANEEKTEPVKK